MRLIDAASSGGRRATLEALRDLLADTLVQAEERNVSSLAGRLADVLRELDGFATEEGSVVDDLASRRANRHSATEAL